MAIRSLAVFCGSKEGVNPLFAQQARQLGQLMAENNVKLIYGGGSAGIMGVIADAVMKHGGKVTGIIPKLLLEWEVQHLGITELIISDDMHVRKKTIYSLCDAALILPGGFGTLDELFEIVTWNQLTIHDKDIYILNSGGFYDHLIRHIQHMREEKFLYEEAEKRITVINDPSELVVHFKS
ncbi:MAG: TIGR00730 family Rossman fold protein [Chitinophagaceae bacterium]